MSDNDTRGLAGRLVHYLTPIDGRFEDLRTGNTALNVFRDFAAGLIVAAVAIPLAMGFAMASGLRPEQGIVGGAIAGFIGAMAGGSKYQVYGPTAAFIPIIAALMLKYDHAMLVAVSILAGVILLVMGIARLGRYVAWVPHSIVIGFTIGIAIVIALSQLGSVLGLQVSLGYGFFEQVAGVYRHIGEVNVWAIVIALVTYAVTRGLLSVSLFIPAPLIALGVSTVLSTTVLASSNLTTIKAKYGSIPTDFWVFTPPRLPDVTLAVLGDLVYFVAAVVLVSAIESLLCSRMADRLAENKGLPFDPNKELWGQGWVQILVPLLNGFPHTGALARTATNIKVGAVSPLAGIFKCFLKLGMAAWLATYLEMVPMACIGGILLYIAIGMVKATEVKLCLAMGRYHTALMVFTAVMVVVTDFLKGVVAAMIVYAILKKQFEASEREATSRLPAAEEMDRQVA